MAIDKDKLAYLLTKHEGINHNLYRDSTGNWTIGVGHNITAKGLTSNQIYTILSDDIDDTLAFISTHFPWFDSLDEVRQRAIADMTFDLMDKMLDFKKLISAIESKDWPTASNEVLSSVFGQQTGKRARDIAAMLRTGQEQV